MSEASAALESAIMGLLVKRQPGKTICPSEAARVVYSAEKDWRSGMVEVRKVASDLAAQGLLEVTQGGQVVDIKCAKGAIRLRLPPTH